MGNSAQCCYRREDACTADGLEQPFRATRCESWHSIPDATEEQWSFFERLQEVSEADQERSPSSPLAFVAGTTAEDGGVSSQAEETPGEDKATPLLPVQPAQKRRSSGGGDHSSRFDRSHTWTRLRANSRPLALVPEEVLNPPCAVAASPLTRTEDQAFLHLVDGFRQKVRQEWEKKLECKEKLDERVQQNLQDGFHELEEWTTDEICLRMLRAVVGDEKQASAMLVKAIECRVRDRELYSTLTCEVCHDVRVIGRDRDHRPVVYMCARNQTKTLKDCESQLALAFEAAVRLSEGEGNGRVLFIADMHGFSTKLNCDPYAYKELGGTFGTVFADRFSYILIVDFSFLAQSLWAMARPLISERTQKKINFVNNRKARELCEEKLTTHTFNRVVSAFDINRAKGITAEEREEHARRTSICDVPLGLLRPADHAG
mmetsp:Transcript_23845/g.80536  ORF Transcript_23845/g.80536 Transcript_23845/m.80536 type:complete len:432 (-) Transcript_23845:116-1411(-)